MWSCPNAEKLCLNLCSVCHGLFLLCGLPLFQHEPRGCLQLRAARVGLMSLFREFHLPHRSLPPPSLSYLWTRFSGNAQRDLCVAAKAASGPSRELAHDVRESAPLGPSLGFLEDVGVLGIMGANRGGMTGMWWSHGKTSIKIEIGGVIKRLNLGTFCFSN